jgi:hypothetical protein
MKMSGNIWERSYYTSRLPYLIGQYITEYDIIKANINILYHYGVIDKALYDYLYLSDKGYRESYIGKLQRDNPEVSTIKSKGIMEFRKRFIEANGINPQDIISIKGDALFVIGSLCKYTKFENIEYRIANRYNAYMKIRFMEVYYGFDPISGDEVIDIKGIKDDKLELHRDHMMRFLCDMFYKLLNEGAEEAIKLSQQYLEVVLTKSSPDVEYYRSFDVFSGFNIRTDNLSYYLPYLNYGDSMIPYINTNTTVQFLNELLSILSDIYLKEKK